MKAFFGTLAVCGMLSLPAAHAQAQYQTHPFQQLSGVHTIYVAPLGQAADSETIRQKIINRLTKSGLITVVDNPQVADAVLTGTSEVDRHHSSIPLATDLLTGGPHESAECVVRLVGRNDEILWSDEAESRKLLGPKTTRGATSNVADKTVTKLLQAIKTSRGEGHLLHMP